MPTQALDGKDSWCGF